MHDNHFSSSFNLGTYYWDKFSFCKKKKHVGLCFPVGNIRPLENGPNLALKISDLVTTLY